MASEWTTLGYFAYLAAAAGLAPFASRRLWVLTLALLTMASVAALGVSGNALPAVVVRDWAPLAYLLLGYWLPARLVGPPNAELEQALLALDRRWIGPERLTAFGERGPRVLVELLETSYLFCYLLVPAGYALLYGAGLRAESDRFWTAVLVAGFSCYGVLPWLPTRPPRSIETPPARARSTVRRFNLRVLDLASVGLNTFPSGHVAVALATALAVGAVLPAAGAGLGLVAVGVGVGSVVGRYHYAADSVAGAVLALVGFAISRFV